MDDHASAGGCGPALATADQLDELIAFAALSADAPHWPVAAWKSFLQAPDPGTNVKRCLFTFREGAGVAGAIAVAVLGHTTELEVLLVRPSSRRRGVGQALAAHWLQWAGEAGIREAVLEVRASNAAAQALYRKLGFETQGVRRHYYSGPLEDALLLRCILAERVPAQHGSRGRGEHRPIAGDV